MSDDRAALAAVLGLLPNGATLADAFQQAFDARQYRVDTRGAAFVAIAEPPLPNGTVEAERPSYEQARAVARLWRLEHGGKVVEGGRK